MDNIKIWDKNFEAFLLKRALSQDSEEAWSLYIMYKVFKGEDIKLTKKNNIYFNTPIKEIFDKLSIEYDIFDNN